jgi:hypothetical protein
MSAEAIPAQSSVAESGPNLTVDGQDASEAAGNKEELEKLLEETSGPQEIVPEPVDIDALKAERLSALVNPVHLLSTHTRVLLYGAQGTSKTTLSMHAPKPLLVAIEAGQKSLLNHPETRNSMVMEFKSVQQIEDLARLTRIGKFGQEYETYSLDTFSELEKTVVSERVGSQWMQNPQLRDRYTPEGKDYQSSGEHMRQIAAAFRDVPKNILFVCQEVNKDGIWQPSLPDKVLNKVGEYCDVIARMTADWSDPDNPVFTMQTRRTPGVLAKSRIKLLPTMINDATFDLIHRANMKQVSDAIAAQTTKGN